MSQDQAVIGWLATHPPGPTLTRDLLNDVRVVWEVLASLPAVTALRPPGHMASPSLKPPRSPADMRR